jgi:hypothetical protein
MSAFLTLALMQVVSFKPRPLYPQGKRSWYQLDRRLGGLQSRSGRVSEGKSAYSYRESNPSCPSHSLVTVLTELQRLLVNKMRKRNMGFCSATCVPS